MNFAEELRMEAERVDDMRIASIVMVIKEECRVAMRRGKAEVHVTLISLNEKLEKALNDEGLSVRISGEDGFYVSWA